MTPVESIGPAIMLSVFITPPHRATPGWAFAPNAPELAGIPGRFEVLRPFGSSAVDRDLCRLLDEVVPRDGVSDDTEPLVAHCGPKTSTANIVQPLTKVRVRHHQIDQPTVLGTRYTRNAQRARLTGTDGALRLRLFPDLDHVDSSETASVPPAASRVGTARSILGGVRASCPRMLASRMTSATDGYGSSLKR